MLSHHRFSGAPFTDWHSSVVAGKSAASGSALSELAPAGQPGLPRLALDTGWRHFPALDDLGVSLFISGGHLGLRMDCVRNRIPNRPGWAWRQLPPSPPHPPPHQDLSSEVNQIFRGAHVIENGEDL